MAALQSSEITKAAVEPISAMGGEIAKLAKQAPNLIPIPGSGGQSLASLRTATSSVTNAYTSDASNRGSQLGTNIASRL
jgi:hypothetical protein